MDGGSMLAHQAGAGVSRLVQGAGLAMLPVLTYGCLQSYMTIGLPQLLQPNQTGILIDLHKMSWISKTFSCTD